MNAAIRACVPDFSVTVTPAVQATGKGSSTTYTVTVTPSGGFTGAVSLSVAGLPIGATSTFNPSSVTGPGASVLTITAAQLTVPGTYPLTVTGSSGTLSHTVTGLSFTVTAPGTTTAVTASSNPATYGASVTLTAAVAATGTPTGTVTFTDGATTLGSRTLDAGGQATLTLSTLSVGAHAITALYSGDATFDPSTSLPLAQVVTPAALTITANDKSKVYGAANPALTVSYSGFVNGDTSAILTTAADASRRPRPRGSGVGTYSITATGAVAANYAITYVAGTLTVTPAPLTITADGQDQGLRVREPGADGELQRLRQRRHGGEPDHAAERVDDGDDGQRRRDLSDYRQRRGQPQRNYTISYVAGTLTVTKAALTVTANDATRAYGAANPTLTRELRRLRERRHGGEPDYVAERVDDRDERQRCRALSDHGQRRGQLELHVHLRQRHADGERGDADDHRQRQDEGVRRGRTRR